MSIRFRRPAITHTVGGCVGLALLFCVLAVALLGPLVAPHDPTEPIGLPGALPSRDQPLGLDHLGRDGLSRFLHGGFTVVALGLAATLVCYAVGLIIGLIAAYTRSVIDPILMRCVDILLAFPAMVLFLLLVASLGTSVPVLLLGVLLVQLPGITRLVRTVTLEVSTRAYVEAAVARGERMHSVLYREVLPNIMPTIAADFGIRFSFSIVAIASVNYLGLGLQPPASDWALIIAENRQLIGVNHWAVLPPALALVALTVSINLITDAYARTLGRRRPVRASRRAATVASDGPAPSLSQSQVDLDDPGEPNSAS